jgi:hypothetical protein
MKPGTDWFEFRTNMSEFIQQHALGGKKKFFAFTANSERARILMVLHHISEECRTGEGR